MTPRRTFSFDGFGINGPDKYRTRLATFTGAGLDYPGLGPLLEAAPDLLQNVRELLGAFNVRDVEPIIAFAAIERARATLERLEGLK